MRRNAPHGVRDAYSIPWPRQPQREHLPPDERLEFVLVAFGFPPGFGPGVARPLAWANHLAARGHRVTVLTAPLESQLRAGMMREPTTLALDPGVRVVPLPALGIDRLAALSTMARLGRLFEFFLVAEAGWAAAVATWLLHHATPSTIVVSTYQPIASMFATLVARQLRSFIWIADYRDPWVLRDNPMPSVAHMKAALLLDTRIHYRANGVIYTSSIDLKNAIATYRVSPRRALIIRNGVEDDAFGPASDTSDDSLILYGGNLYAAPETPARRLTLLDRFYVRKVRYSYDTYSLVPLFRAVNFARNELGAEVRVEIAGSVGQDVITRALSLAGADPYSSWAVSLGMVDKQTLSRLYERAGALYLPVPGRADGGPCGWLPQKTFEVLGGDRPVIVSSPPQGEVRDVLRSRRGVFFLDGPPIADAAQVLRALSSGRHSRPKSRWRRVSQAKQVEAFARTFLPGGTRASIDPP